MREAPSMLVAALRPGSSCTVSGLRLAALWRSIPARASPSSCECALAFEHAADLPSLRVRHTVRQTEQVMLGRGVRCARQPGGRFGEIAMTIFNEGRHAIRALGAAVAATAGRVKNCFAQGLTRSEWAPLTIIAGSPDRRIAGSPDRRIAGSPDRRIAGSPDRRIALPASFLVAPPKALRLPA